MIVRKRAIEILEGMASGDFGRLSSKDRADLQEMRRRLVSNLMGTDALGLILNDETGADAGSARWVRYPANARKVLTLIELASQVRRETEELRIRRINEMTGPAFNESRRAN